MVEKSLGERGPGKAGAHWVGVLAMAAPLAASEVSTRQSRRSVRPGRPGASLLAPGNGAAGGGEGVATVAVVSNAAAVDAEFGGDGDACTGVWR